MVRFAIYKDNDTGHTWSEQISEADFQSGVESMFNEKWNNASTQKSDEARQKGYSEALNFIYDSYSSDFSAVASKKQFYFQYGVGRGETKSYFQTDERVGIKEDHPNQAGITMYNETVSDITGHAHSFGFTSRALLHEMYHVRDLFVPRSYAFAKPGDEELNAYYRSSTNLHLPDMTSEEATGNAQNAIRSFMTTIPHSMRPAIDSLKLAGKS